MSSNYFKDPFKSLREPKKLVLVAMLMALAVATSLLNIQLTAALRLSFSFLFIALIAMKYGPFIAGVAGGIVDLIQFLVKPTGPYQPLLTLTAVLTGVVYGIFLYRDRRGPLWVILSHTAVTLVISTLLNSYFISVLYGKVFLEFLISRTVKNAIMFVPELLLLFAVIEVYYRIEKQVFKSPEAQSPNRQEASPSDKRD